MGLQDQQGYRINPILFALWLGTRGIPLHETSFAGQLKATQAWYAQVINPIRCARRATPLANDALPAASQIIQTLLDAELAAEQEEQRQLCASLEAKPDKHLSEADCLLHNLRLCSRLLGHEQAKIDRPALAILLGRCATSLTETDLKLLLETPNNL